MSGEVASAIEVALTVHDGMQRLIREDSLPADAFDPVEGFMAALRSGGVYVVAATDLTEAVERIDAAVGPTTGTYKDGWIDAITAVRDELAASSSVQEGTDPA